MTDEKAKPLFELGALVSTVGALAAFADTNEEPLTYLARHVNGDWGTLCAEDCRENDWSVANGCRILSAYRLKNGTRIFVITEADRSATTLLLPEEY